MACAPSQVAVQACTLLAPTLRAISCSLACPSPRRPCLSSAAHSDGPLLHTSRQWFGLQMGLLSALPEGGAQHLRLGKAFASVEQGQGQQQGARLTFQVSGGGGAGW